MIIYKTFIYIYIEVHHVFICIYSYDDEVCTSGYILVDRELTFVWKSVQSSVTIERYADGDIRILWCYRYHCRLGYLSINRRSLHVTCTAGHLTCTGSHVTFTMNSRTCVTWSEICVRRTPRKHANDTRT